MTPRALALAMMLSALVVAGPAAAQGTAAGPEKEGAPIVRMMIDASNGRTAEVCVSAEDRGGGVNKIELTVEGQPLRPRRRAAVSNETGEECPSTAVLFDVELVPGNNNRFEAVAYASNGAASQIARDSAQGTSPAAGTTLHILTVGIDAYPVATMRLSYASRDARAFADSLSKQSRALFQNIIIDSLYNEAVTKSAVEMKFAEIAERVGENDTFVFFYAGHGAVGSFGGTEGVFYLVPANVSDLANGKMLALTAISAATLQQYLSWIPARNKLMVLDACNSGAVVNFFAGKDALGPEVLGLVGSRSSTGILAATQPSQPARESSVMGHGLFTAALLQNDPRPGDRAEMLDIGEIVQLTKRAFMVLVKEYAGNIDQEPKLMAPVADFPLVVR